MSSAHAFVCGGYDGEGMFHFNWGWDGKADGYFAIDFLNPVVEEEPWKTGYNGSQSAVLNIHPRSTENPGTPIYTVWLDSYYVNPATGYGDDSSHTLHPGDSFRMRCECQNYYHLPFLPVRNSQRYSHPFTTEQQSSPIL